MVFQVIEVTSSWSRYEDHLVGDTRDCSFFWEILDACTIGTQREILIVTSEIDNHPPSMFIFLEFTVSKSCINYTNISKIVWMA
ncbi:hypothetical protein Bca101_084363 [Brassica carinata]